MTHVTNSEKEELLVVLNRYVQAQDGQKLSVKRYQRLVSWLNGTTYDDIAEREGVSRQAVAQSVQRDIEILKKFAKQ